MITYNVLPLLFLLASVRGDVQNKTKRTIPDHIFFHGDTSAMPRHLGGSDAQSAAAGFKSFYASSPAKPLALVNVQQPVQVFGQDNPKEVAEQQVLYEFQQTPTNAVSNVHVKQLFQPSVEVTTPNSYQQQQQFAASYQTPAPFLTQQQAPVNRAHPYAAGLTAIANPAASSTIVHPVQQNTFFAGQVPQHNSNYQQNPVLSAPPRYQVPVQQNNPQKYIYLNGKIVFNPNANVATPTLSNYQVNQGVYHNQQKLPLVNYAQRHNTPIQQAQQIYTQERQNLIPPITHGFHPPKQMQQIDKPSVPVRQEAAEEEDERETDEQEDDDTENNEENDNGNEEDDDDDDKNEQRENEESEDDDEKEQSPKHSFDKEDFDPESHYFGPSRYHQIKSFKDAYDADDDNYRGASTRYSRYPTYSRRYRNLPKFNKHFDETEALGSTDKVSKKLEFKKMKKYVKPAGKYRKITFFKPKNGKIKGMYSENIPIDHKQKVHKERWYVTQDVDGDGNRDKKR